MKIAIISLARKGSKRIPNKSFKNFCDKPLITYTLDIMKELKEYESYVFTDFPEIKECIKKEYSKINIIDMPEEYGRDKHILMESLRYMDDKIKADMYVLLQPTSPLRFPVIVQQAIDIMVKNEKYKSGFSVFELPKKYYWMDSSINFNQNIRDGNGCEKKPLFVENGSIYIFRKEVLKYNHVIVHPFAKFIDKFIFDLDTEKEWVQAEKFYNLLCREPGVEKDEN